MKKNIYVPLVICFLIASSCLRDKEAQNVSLTAAEKLAKSKEVFSAVESGDDKQLEKLLAQGVDVNYKRASDGATALHLIAQNGRAPIGGYLVSNGADVNARDNAGGEPLHWAVENGHLAVARLLLQKGADVNARRNDSLAPLDIAISKGNAKIVEFLKGSGAKSNGSAASL